jgi:glycosyltransferase involved in cell wall biosynthesis
MKIAIYNRGLVFDGATPVSQPLGGSESSIVYMARELARAGHDVTVYCKTPSPSGRGQSEGPGEGLKIRNNLQPSTDASRRPLPDGEATYVHYHQFFSDYTAMPWDAVISFRSFDPFLLGRVAPRMIYWTGDASDQKVLTHFEHPVLQENIDLVFCVSQWHRQSFIDAFHLPSEKVVATRNGFCPELIRHASTREWTRCAYSSTPFRGLDILLKIFPEIRTSFPDLHLDVFSSMKLYGWTSEDDQNEFRSIYESARQPGIEWHRSVPQPALLDSLGKTGLFLYPNTFDETSCIAAIEAQASGCVVVTSAKAGLNETVQNRKTGICLPGDPTTPDYQQEFVRTVCGLLSNPARMAELSEAAKRRAFDHYSWGSIASEWTNLVQCMPARIVHSRWSGPLSLLQKTHDLLQKGNVSAATRVLMTVEQTPFLRNEVEAAKRKRDSAQPQAMKGQLSTWM